MRKSQDLLRDLKSEPGRHPREESLSALWLRAESLREYLLALDNAVRDMGQDTFYRKLEPHLDNVAKEGAQALDWLATRLRNESPGAPPDCPPALAEADAAYRQLRASRSGVDHGDDEILRFGAFYFNLRTVTRIVGLMVDSVQTASQSAAEA